MTNWIFIIELICKLLAGLAFIGTILTLWLSNFYKWAEKVFEILAQLMFWIGWSVTFFYAIS